MKSLLTIVLFGVVGLAEAANVYIRGGGSGAGTSWSDARGSFPTTVYRTNTYWLGNGTVTIDDMDVVPTSFTGPHVVIKKATASDHGTDTGWNSAYANQVIISGNTFVNYNGWVFDGKYRDESNPPWSWTNASAYGIYWDAAGMAANSKCPGGATIELYQLRISC